MTERERILIREYNQMSHYLKWSQLSRETQGYFLHCEYCNKRVAFLANAKSQQIKPNDFMVYVLKHYFMPHIKDPRHRQAEMLFKLGGDSLDG